MFNLMRLEMKKFKIRGYIIGAMIANVVIVALLFLMSSFEKSEGNIVVFNSYDFMLSTVSIFVKGTFIVFASVLISRFVIDEFRTKSITVLFMYPINRKKLIAAKLLLVVIFTFISIILSDIIVSASISGLDHYFELSPDKLTTDTLVRSSISMLMNAIAATGMSLIPIFIGMRKYSTPATIVSSLIIVAIVCSNNGGFSLSNIIAIPIALAVVGVIIAYLSIRKVERIDLIK